MVRPRISIEEHRRWLRSSYLLERIRIDVEKVKEVMKENIFGKASDFFVGSSSWPYLNAGPIVAVDDYIFPKDLYGLDYEGIIYSRLSTARGKRFSYAYNPRILEGLRDIAMSVRPIDAEVEFTRKPLLEIRLSPYVQPLGPSAPLKKLVEAENPKIPGKVYSLEEEDVKAEIAVGELVDRGFDNYYITRIFSAGVLGKEKRLVPTRWSITAVDDIISRKYIEEIRDYKELEEVRFFTNYYLHNQFVIILFPSRWEFENFEAWAPKTSWGVKGGAYILEEYENLRGRKGYAIQAGGYYATRLAITEYLKKIRRQAGVIVFREVYEGFYIPVGVWQVRENVRRALQQKPKVFSSLDEALREAQKYLRLPLGKYLSKSRMLAQRKLLPYLPK